MIADEGLREIASVKCSIASSSLPAQHEALNYIHKSHHKTNLNYYTRKQVIKISTC